MLPPEKFLARAACGEWAPGWAEADEFFNYLTFICYMITPAAIVFGMWLSHRKKIFRFMLGGSGSVMFTVSLSSFVIFLFFCGIHHYYEGLAFASPQYHRQTVVDGFMALFSLISVLVTPYTILHLTRKIGDIIER